MISAIREIRETKAKSQISAITSDFWAPLNPLLYRRHHRSKINFYRDRIRESPESILDPSFIQFPRTSPHILHGITWLITRLLGPA